MEWVDGNLGSKLTMKYPAVILKGARAHGEVLSIAFAGEGQHQDAGAKITHMAPQHDLGDHVEVDLARTAAGPRTAACCASTAAPRARARRSSATR